VHVQLQVTETVQAAALAEPEASLWRKGFLNNNGWGMQHTRHRMNNTMMVFLQTQLNRGWRKVPINSIGLRVVLAPVSDPVRVTTIHARQRLLQPLEVLLARDPASPTGSGAKPSSMRPKTTSNSGKDVGQPSESEGGACGSPRLSLHCGELWGGGGNTGEGSWGPSASPL
jgi:hypothetical protein